MDHKRRFPEPLDLLCEQRRGVGFESSEGIFVVASTHILIVTIIVVVRSIGIIAHRPSRPLDTFLADGHHHSPPRSEKFSSRHQSRLMSSNSAACLAGSAR